MNLKRLFINRFNDIRAGWRILIFILITLFTSVPLGIIIYILFPQILITNGKEHLLLINGILSTGILVLISFVTLKFVDGRPFKLLGLNFYSKWWLEFALGLAVGLFIIGLTFFSMLIFNFIQLTSLSMPINSIMGWGLFYMGLFLFAALSEEVMFRGYIFQVFVEGTNPLSGVIVISILFGLVHLMNPNASLISTLNLILAGAVLATAYLKTRGLWMPLGLHLAWNFSEGFIFSLPVSGINLRHALVEVETSGNSLFTGGDFGPEASIFASIFIILAIIFISTTKRIRPGTEMIALSSKYYEKKRYGEMENNSDQHLCQ
ncbi:MAG: lysostaphin resistance A-like protein [Fidelibacterota bacterium]